VSLPSDSPVQEKTEIFTAIWGTWNVHISLVLDMIITPTDLVVGLQNGQKNNDVNGDKLVVCLRFQMERAVCSTKRTMC